MNSAAAHSAQITPLLCSSSLCPACSNSSLHLFCSSEALGQHPRASSREWPSLEAGTLATSPLNAFTPHGPAATQQWGWFVLLMKLPPFISFPDHFWVALISPQSAMTSGYFASRKKYIWKSITLALLSKASFAPVLPRLPSAAAQGFPWFQQLLWRQRQPSSELSPSSSSDPLSVFKSRDPRKSLKDFCDVVKPDPLLSYLLGSHQSRTGTFSSHRHLRVAFPEAPGEQAHQNLENSRSPSLPVHNLLKMREEAIQIRNMTLLQTHDETSLVLTYSTGVILLYLLVWSNGSYQSPFETQPCQVTPLI